MYNYSCVGFQHNVGLYRESVPLCVFVTNLDNKVNKEFNI